MVMDNLPPLVPTEVLPREIVGCDYDMFMAYCQTFYSHDSETAEKKIRSGFSPEARSKVVEIMDKLRSYGFFPFGIKKDGHVQFGYILKSKLQMDFEKGLNEYKGKSRVELAQMARAGYRSMKADNIYPDGNDYEMARDGAY